MTELDIIQSVYNELISKIGKSGIPVNLRAKSLIGTVQDDPFDTWIELEIKKALPKAFEIFHSGSLTTPDLVVRDKKSGIVVGLEIKKLIQKSNGSDSRGLTIDYNSSLPCGSTLIKVGDDTIVIPCFYLFALLDNSSKNIVTLIILDGDFLNYDFDLHKEAKMIEEAVEKALELDIVTPDLNPNNTKVTTSMVGDFIHDYILHPEDRHLNTKHVYLGQSTII